MTIAWGMTGRYTGSYLDRSNGWRAVADRQASLVKLFWQLNLVARAAWSGQNLGEKRAPSRRVNAVLTLVNSD